MEVAKAAGSFRFDFEVDVLLSAVASDGSREAVELLSESEADRVEG